MALALVGCAVAPTRPAAWSPPEAFVAPSAFAGVHGLAIDVKGRLLAGSVAGSSMWVVDRQTGSARMFIPPHEGQADDIAIGPKGELAWTSFLQGVLRDRENDDAPIRVLAKDLPGINSLDFDRRNGAAKRLTQIDAATGAKRTVAENLPVGMPVAPGMPPIGYITGVAVDAQGNVYASSDLNNAVSKVRPQR